MAGTDFSHLTNDELIKGIKALDLPDYIRSKAYGIDVRETLAQMTEMLMQLAFNQGMDPQQAQDWVSQLNNKIVKGQVTMADLTQEVKEALTGGAVAVVGENAVSTVNLVDNSVTEKKVVGVSLERGNLYDVDEHFVANYYSGAQGKFSPATDWGAALVPVDSETNKEFSLLLERGIYNGDIGTIGYLDSERNTLGFAPSTYPIAGNYNGISYLNLTVPSGTSYIAVTVVRPPSQSDSYDNKNGLIIVEGNVINDDVLKDQVYEIFGGALVDKIARENIGKISKTYIGKKWVAFGDSLTEVNSRTTKNYHSYVADDLGLEVTNMGVSGTGYKRTDANNTAFYQRISNVPTDTDVITIFGSFNDIGSTAPIGTASDTTTDTIAGAMNVAIDNLYTKLPTVPLGIIAPTPWVNADLKDDSNRFTQYVKVMEEICSNRGIPFLNLYRSSGLRPWDAEYRTLMYSRDGGNGVHPDENGHKLIYPQFREFIKKLI